MKTVAVSTVLLRKGFFLSMSLFLQKEKQISKRWQNKRCFYGNPRKNAAKMKPFELAGFATSVKPSESLSEGGWAKEPLPAFPCVPSGASPAEKKKWRKKHYTCMYTLKGPVHNSSLMRV